MGAFEIITYSLTGNYENCNGYYNDIKKAKNAFYLSVSVDAENIIQKYMQYIKSENKEIIRTKEEYFIEYIMINIFMEDYLQNVHYFKKTMYPVFRLLYLFRKNEKYKTQIDKLRGVLNYKVLYKQKSGCNRTKLKDLKELIIWLKACGDFEEEIIRIKLWYVFLCCHKEIVSEFFMVGNKSIDKLKNIGNEFLGKYTSNVKEYLKSYAQEHYNKEDIIYCGKSITQYYFNMICSEIMNEVYHEKFINTKNKFIFVPACMRQTQHKCMSIKENYGYRCVKCSKECNICKLSNLGDKNGFKVFIIPHESSLLKLNALNNSNIGIIGIACVINLISGGFKAIRLGFIPQCVVLNECGCSGHWYKEPHMTQINDNRIMEILNK